LALGLVGGERLATRNGDREELRRRVDVVEVQAEDAAVVAADRAAAAASATRMRLIFWCRRVTASPTQRLQRQWKPAFPAL